MENYIKWRLEKEIVLYVSALGQSQTLPYFVSFVMWLFPTLIKQFDCEQRKEATRYTKSNW